MNASWSSHPARARHGIVVSLTLAVGCLVAACGKGDDTPPAPVDGTCTDPPPPQKPPASCEVTLLLPPEQVAASRHVPEGTSVKYCSNPPSSGPHYPIWADFTEYAKPVEAPYLVHSLEHGAIELFWRCLTPDCPERTDIVAALRKIRDGVPVDPVCVGGTRARIIIAPSTTITTDVAAAAWGATYEASCVDVPTLEAFIRDHYARSPENTCAPGRTF